MIPESEVRERLRTHVKDRYGTYFNAAIEMGVEPSYLSDVFRGAKLPPAWMLMEIGVSRRRVWVFEETGD